MESKRNMTIITSSNPDDLYMQYIYKPVIRTFREDFMDADTAEVVEIERNSLLFEKGTFIDRDILAQLTFFLQSGDVKEVTVCNQKRNGFLLETFSPILYTVTVETYPKKKKSKLLIHARSAQEAINITADFGELNYSSGFIIKGLKAFSECIYINYEQYQATDNFITEEKKQDMVYYMVSGNVTINENVQYDYTFILLALDVESAKKTIHAYLAVNKQDVFGPDDWYFNVLSAGPTQITHVVDPEFCKEYYDSKEQEQ